MIETDRLILRRWRSDDVAPFHRMGQDAQVMQFIGLSMSLPECEAIAQRMNRLADADGDCFWAVERRDDGAFIGFCGIKPGPEGTPIEGQPEIGWRLARAVWGRGMAREAAEACLLRAWQRQMAIVHAITVPANERSRGLMIRLGMTQVAGGDYDHPALPIGDPLRRHLHYAIGRPNHG